MDILILIALHDAAFLAIFILLFISLKRGFAVGKKRAIKKKKDQLARHAQQLIKTFK